MPDIVCVSRIVGVHATLHVDEVRPRRGDRVIHILRHDEQVVARARLVERVDLLGARRARHDRDTPAAASIGAAVLVRPPAARMNDRLLARRELGARDPDAAAGTGVIARVLVVAARHVNLAVQRHLAARRKAHRAAALAESVRTVSARRTRIERRIRPAIGLCVAAAAVAAVGAALASRIVTKALRSLPAPTVAISVLHIVRARNPRALGDRHVARNIADNRQSARLRRVDEQFRRVIEDEFARRHRRAAPLERAPVGRRLRAFAREDLDRASAVQRQRTADRKIGAARPLERTQRNLRAVRNRQVARDRELRVRVTREAKRKRARAHDEVADIDFRSQRQRRVARHGHGVVRRRNRNAVPGPAIKPVAGAVEGEVARRCARLVEDRDNTLWRVHRNGESRIVLVRRRDIADPADERAALVGRRNESHTLKLLLPFVSRRNLAVSAGRGFQLVFQVVVEPHKRRLADHGNGHGRAFKKTVGDGICPDRAHQMEARLAVAALREDDLVLGADDVAFGHDVRRERRIRRADAVRFGRHRERRLAAGVLQVEGRAGLSVQPRLRAGIKGAGIGVLAARDICQRRPFGLREFRCHETVARAGRKERINVRCAGAAGRDADASAAARRGVLDGLRTADGRELGRRRRREGVARDPDAAAGTARPRRVAPPVAPEHPDRAGDRDLACRMQAEESAAVSAVRTAASAGGTRPVRRIGQAVDRARLSRIGRRRAAAASAVARAAAVHLRRALAVIAVRRHPARLIAIDIALRADFETADPEDGRHAGLGVGIRIDVARIARALAAQEQLAADIHPRTAAAVLLFTRTRRSHVAGFDLRSRLPVPRITRIDGQARRAVVVRDHQVAADVEQWLVDRTCVVAELESIRRDHHVAAHVEARLVVRGVVRAVQLHLHVIVNDQLRADRRIFDDDRALARRHDRRLIRRRDVTERPVAVHVPLAVLRARIGVLDNLRLALRIPCDERERLRNGQIERRLEKRNVARVARPAGERLAHDLRCL